MPMDFFVIHTNFLTQAYNVTDVFKILTEENMCNDNYVVKSLELHLFFGRIMKEHSLFLKAGFTPADKNFSEKTKFIKKC